MAVSYKRHHESSIHNLDAKLNEILGWFLSSAFKENGKELGKLKDLKTLVSCYKKTREYKEQADEHGILTAILNRIIEELVKQLQPYYTSTIVNSIGVGIQFKKEEEKGRVVEVNSNVSFGAPIKPYVEFIVEINKKESYSVKFIFQLESSATITKLRLSSDVEKRKSANIEKVGIKIELSLLEIAFSDLVSSSSQISLNKKIKLGSKDLEIHDISLYGPGAAAV